MEKETKRFILANFYVSIILLAVAYLIRLLLSGSLWLSLSQVPGWLGLIFRIPLFLLMWLPIATSIHKKMKIKEEIGSFLYINAIFSIIIFMSLFYDWKN